MCCVLVCFDTAVGVRYPGPMNLSVPLTPHLEQFKSGKQLASGLFQTESDVILTALQAAGRSVPAPRTLYPAAQTAPRQRG